MSDDGFEKAPARYSAQGRETIDRMRDLAYKEAQNFVECEILDRVREFNFTNEQKKAIIDSLSTTKEVERLGDWVFMVFCRLTALGYQDRLGLKEGVSKDRDQRAAAFYNQMAAHLVHDEIPDPRYGRPDFTPYKRLNEE